MSESGGGGGGASGSGRMLALLLSCAIASWAAGCAGGREGSDAAALAESHSLEWSSSKGPSVSQGFPSIGASPEGSAQTLTTQIPVASLAPTSGYPLDGCWLATSDGAFETTVKLRGGPTGFLIRLKAVRSAGDWPSLRVLLDGKEIGAARLDANAPDQGATEQFISPRYRWIDVPVSSDAPPGPARLRVEYVCSHFDPIERVALRGIFFDRVFVQEHAAPADSCPASPLPDAGRKVLLIGLDGASWSILLPMINHGLLPNLGALVTHGSYGPLNSEPPTYSPAIWSSINTGQPRAVHGIVQMSAKTPAAYTSDSHSTRTLKSATLWQMATAAGKSCAIIGMYTSWPAQPVRGVMVSDRSFRTPIDGGVWPPEQAQPVRDALAELEQRKDTVPEEFPQALRESAACDARVVSLAGAYLSQGQPDLTAVYLASTDHAGHLLWREHAPFGLDHRYDGAAPRGAPGPDPLERAYMFVDGLVGKMLSSVDREKTAVVIVSDHSCDSADPVTPRRYHLGELIKAASDGKAYIPFDETWVISQVYLNLKGRETEGVVDPADYTRVAEEVKGELLALRTDAGRKVFEAAEALPRRTVGADDYQPADIVGIMNANLEMTEKVLLPGGKTIPVSKLVHVQTNRTGTHDRFGIILMDGPGVRPGVLIHSSTILDVVPTELALLGLPRGADLPGRPIEEALAERVASPCFVPSYNPLARQAPEPAKGKIPAGLSPEEIEKLKSLGYVQ